MKILENFSRSFNRYIINMGRARVRGVLLQSSDRMLEDAGFSRELLESGLEAWPWHAPEITLNPLNLRHDNTTKAIRELRSRNDTQLHESDTPTGSTPEQIMLAQEDIEHNRERKVA